MKQLCVRLNPNVAKTLQEKAENLGITVSCYIRQLIDLALQLQDGQQKPQTLSGLNAVLDDNLFKQMLTWGLETRFLSRYLVGQIMQDDAEAGSVNIQPCTNCTLQILLVL